MTTVQVRLADHSKALFTVSTDSWELAIETVKADLAAAGQAPPRCVLALIQGGKR